MRDPALAHLTLAELRAHREALQAEETRVSYWRRLLQARMDVLRSSGPDHAGVPLRTVLSKAAGRPGRTARVDVLPADGDLPLPDLPALWQAEPRTGPEVDDVLARMASAEAALSQVRHGVHVRLDAATAELVARYHEDPRLCLQVLPLDPR